MFFFVKIIPRSIISRICLHKQLIKNKCIFYSDRGFIDIDVEIIQLNRYFLY